MDDAGAAILQFMDDLCRDWGFCLPPEKRHALAIRGGLDAQQFAIAFLFAEGIADPVTSRWLPEIRHRFERRFGKGIVQRATEASAAPPSPGQSAPSGDTMPVRQNRTMRLKPS